jgi:hypothetical protein
MYKHWKYVQILAASKNQAVCEILAVSKNQADCEILAANKNQADCEILVASENQVDGKILAGVEPGEIPAFTEKLAELEKQVACLLFRLGGISNCWLLPGPADEHVLLLVDVMNLACSLQVRKELLLPCFYGRTLSRTVPAVCTGPPCQEMAQIHGATKEVNKEQPSYRNLSATATRVLQCTCPVAASRKDCSAIEPYIVNMIR